MLVITVDRSEFQRMARVLPRRHKAAMTTALRAESRRLALRAKAYARTSGEGSWAELSPLTKAVRKIRRQGLAKWWARFARYHVDPEELTGLIGIISADQVDRRSARFELISRGFASAAYRHARGYKFRVTRRTQRALAKVLSRRFKTRRYHKFIPRLGMHVVPARPVVEPVYKREAQRSIRNLKRLYRIKVTGGRYSRSWIEEWGNL